MDKSEIQHSRKLNRAQHDPALCRLDEVNVSAIAIVGMGCRFGGANSLPEFWNLLREGRDAFTPIPEDRWHHDAFLSDRSRDADKTHAPAGSFVDDVREFPALTLGIPPRRVEVMDPQQRFTLWTAIEAIEDAGYTAADLPERTGVYVGLTAMEYRVLSSGRIVAGMMATGQLGDPVEDVNGLANAVKNLSPPRPFTAPGTLGNMSAAIVAQELNLKGPAYTTDAACASAMIAMADAVAQLRAGQIDAALAGGAYLQLTPEHYVAFTRVGAISKQGRCLPFSVGADGFVQGDGVGMVLLKRLDDAVRDNDRIYAVLHGIAINNDGRGDGPMAPRSEGQQAVVRDAWRNAGKSPARATHIEAHGTGTSVGDVTELTALLESLQPSPPSLAIGSSKANIGHSMSAAGIAGIIKAALSIHHRTIPPLAGFSEAKPELPLEGTGIRFPTTAEAWDDPDRLTGISSFGFGGTNGHAVMGAAPEVTPETPPDQLELVTLSAGSQDDLAQFAARLAASIRDIGEVSVASISRTLAGRRPLPVRAALVARNVDVLLQQLDAIANDTDIEGVFRGTAAHGEPQLAFLFPGQGSQRTGMLRSLRTRFPIVAATFDEMADALGGETSSTLQELLYPELRSEAVDDDQASRELTATENCQPTLLAAGVALDALLQRVGVRPTVVTGHSLGEFTAAATAGVVSPVEAARFVARRGRAMASVSGDHGTMAAILAPASDVQPHLEDGVVIANHNHPRQVVISGATEAVHRCSARAENAGLTVKPLVVSHGFHSPVLGDLDSASLVAEMTFSESDITVASGIDPMPYRDASHARDVFSRHATSPVHFTRALQQCVEEGADLFLQVGAGGPLASFARGTLEPGHRGVYTLAGRDDTDDGASLLATLGQLWCAGVTLKLDTITADAPLVTLPPSSLPTETYWILNPARPRTLKLDGVTVSARAAAPIAEAEPEPVTAPAEDDTPARVLAVISRVSAYPLGSLRDSLRLMEDLGFDSIMVGDLSAGLAEAFPGLGGLPQELFIDSPTVGDIIAFVASGGSTEDTIDDNAPLTRRQVVWASADLPDLPGRDLPADDVVVTGANPDDARGLADALQSEGVTVTCVAPTDAAAVTRATCLFWVGPTDVPSVEDVQAGRASWPDEAADLLAVLAAWDQRDQHADVVVVSDAGNPWRGGLEGAARAMAREWSAHMVKHVTLDGVTAAASAAALLDELASADKTVDIRLSADGRGVQTLVQPDDREAEDAPEDIIPEHIAISGGSRGIGLALGLRLASLGHEITLISRSAPSDDVAATIAAFPHVTAIQADVTDRAGLTQALHGRNITAVVHAAGVLADGPVGSVDPIAGVLARRVKAEGWLNLLHATGATCRHACAIGSWAGALGNRHQAHYAAANALLTTIAAEAPSHIRVGIGQFGPWTDSEMVRTIPEPMQRAMRAEGVDFVGEEAGLDALVTDLFEGSGSVIWGRRLPERTTRREVTITLSPEQDPYLVDHAIEGTPILPLAGATDLMAWAAGQDGPFEISDVTLFKGVTVPEEVLLTLRIDGQRAALHVGPERALAYTATVRPASAHDVPEALNGGDASDVTLEDFYGGITFHGPLLHGITAVGGMLPNGVHGTVRAGRPSDWTPTTSRDHFAVDPLALDSVMQLAALVAWQRTQRAGTPVSIGRLVQVRPTAPGELLTAEAHFNGAEIDDATSDRFSATLVLRDGRGHVVMFAEDVVAELRTSEPITSPEEGYTASPEDLDAAHFPEAQDLRMRLDGLGMMGLDNPYFHVHQGTARDVTMVDGRELINYSSYNYLGLSGDPRVLTEVNEAVAQYGTSVSASRVASGERPFHGELEAMLAKAQGQEDALLFTAGHATNVTTIGHLMGPDDLILHDEYIHDSALQGIKLSGAQRRSFRHEDPTHLEEQLRLLRPHYKRCLIIVEGVYSMDGDICELPAYVALKKKWGCLLMVDEAHSFGVVGPTGCGVAEHFGIDGREVDIWMGTLSKSLASCGGWIAASHAMITYLRYTAPGFVYSAGLTAANGVAALASLRFMLEEPERVQKIQSNAAFFHKELTDRGQDTGPALGGSGVVPVITGNSMHALVLSQRLVQQGINVQPIVYPAVPDDASRLRFFLSSTHSEDQLRRTAIAVAETLAAVREEFPVPE